MRYPEVEERYDLYETLGTGGFAKVKAGVHKLTGEKVAVKIMDKAQLGADLPRVYREISALKRLHHQHICQMYEVIETRKMIYVILEFCSSGELFDYIVAKERLKEREARSFFRQILAALHYVHEMGFIHRDLKPENLLLDDDSNIKLIDFGLVAEPDDTQDLLETCCGSPAYAAPELIRGGPYIGIKADVWSLGVLLYALLNGFLPFDDDHTPYLYRLIQRGEYDTPHWLSPGSIAIIARLLNTDPERRISVTKLLEHPWTMDGYSKPVHWRSKIEVSSLDPDCVTEMAHYYQRTEEEMSSEILQWNYDDVTATYFLLHRQKLRGENPAITAPPKKQISLAIEAEAEHPPPSPLASFTFNSSRDPNKSSSDEEEPETPPTQAPPERPSPSPSPETPEKPQPCDEGEEYTSPIRYAERGPETEHNKSSLPEEGQSRRRMSIGHPIHPPPGELLTLHKEGKPVHNIVASLRDESEQERMYLGMKPKSFTPGTTHKVLALRASLPPSVSPSLNVWTADLPPPKQSVKKTRSYDSRLHRIVEDRKTPTPTSPYSQRRRGRLGSFEGLFKKAKKVFKKNESSGPRRIKGIYDVSTTSMQSSDSVIREVERVLQELNVDYKRKNYTLRCCVPSYKKDAKMKTIEFNLEICILPHVDMIGVRRKRLKGDVWEYKRICDHIFKATRL